MLKALAERYPVIIEDGDWLDALVGLGSIEAARLLLDTVCGASETLRKAMRSRHRLEHDLAALAKAHKEFTEELLRRYTEPDGCKDADLLEAALLEMGDSATVVAVIQARALRGGNLDHRLHEAIRRLAIGQTPSKLWKNAMELFSVPLTEFRKHLFGLMADARQAALAQQCLEAIDRLRDEYGRAPGEPRHPDIGSGKPWPLLPDQSESTLVATPTHS